MAVGGAIADDRWAAPGARDMEARLGVTGRVAAVTGAARGIGAAIAAALATAGAKVVVSDVAGDAAAALASRLTAGGGAATSCRSDIADPADAQALVDCAIKTFGRLDILVNNAGIAVTAPFLDLSLADWRRVIDVNLTGTFLCAQAAARVMARQRYGRIINVTSISGQRAGSTRAAYGASKAGVELLTKQIAVELGGQGVTCNAIAPGPIETEMARRLHDQATREAYCGHVPARRYGAPEEIAAAAVFLASEEAGYVNGHVLNVDGGFATAGIIGDFQGARADG
jgi:3-oxoacyl-[acyl-carrier protein] reductase